MSKDGLRPEWAFFSQNFVISRIKNNRRIPSVIFNATLYIVLQTNFS